MVELLVQGVRLLEETIRCWQVKDPLPDRSLFDERVTALLHNGETAAAAKETTADLPPMPAPAAVPAESGKGLQTGERLWVFRFAPSHALADRGININVVRERLHSHGRLLKSTPLILGDGVVTFEFHLATDAPDGLFTHWEEDGLLAELREDVVIPTEPSQPVRDKLPGGAEAYQPLLATSVVRVDLARLDELMRIIGDLVISRAQLQNGIRLLESEVSANELRPLQQLNHGIERQLRELRDGVMRIRMVPMGEVFQRMQFVVRDLSRELGRNIQLELHGQDTEIDKYIVERMVEPLLHLVRNAVGHGIEDADERARAGKPPVARIVLRAATEGDAVVIEIEDDGRGVNAAEVADRARRQGVAIADGVSDEAALLDILCQAGFSTRDTADLASGRGVGMSVVRNTVAELGGSMTLLTEPGSGSCFTICLPLTLAIIDALIIEAGGQTFALPQSSIIEVTQIDPAIVRKLENNEIFPYRQGVLPLLRLASHYGLKSKGNGRHHVLVIGNGKAATGLLVDRVVGQQEIVVRVLNDPLVSVRGISGATELGDGQAVLILDAFALSEAARRKAEDKRMAQERRAAYGQTK